jgi:diaminopimelate epimerase
MRFTKFQGFGNDYIVFEAMTYTPVSDLGDFARRICNRHYGAGSDGIAVVSVPPAVAGGQLNEAADFQVRIFNPDGSEAGMSGNGTRCAASYLFFHRVVVGRFGPPTDAERR